MKLQHIERVDVLRDREDGRYYWRFEGVEGRRYRHRKDCLKQVGRIMGLDPDAITWLTETRWGPIDTEIFDYGQVARGKQTIEVFIWKRWWRRRA